MVDANPKDLNFLKKYVNEDQEILRFGVNKVKDFFEEIKDEEIDGVDMEAKIEFRKENKNEFDDVMKLLRTNEN